MSTTLATRNRALDGLRGVAVAAVVVNHMRPHALPGGWVGVDIFFVLSGYLMTTLLLSDHSRSGRLDLRHFYSRRARRLLPALFLLLGVVAVVARLSPDEPGFTSLRGDGYAALGYVANWRFIATGASYFNAFTPSPLRHLWSLAVEEQFYLLWPLVLIVVLRRHGARTVGIVAIALAAVSAIAMAVMYGDGAHISRIYFGTDTHVHSVLIGCALAAIGPAQRHWRGTGIAALAAVAGIAFAFARLSGTGPVAYRGGIVAVSLCTAVLIAAATSPSGAGAIGRAFSWQPLAALGLISYGVYLWHWPIIEYLNANRTGVTGAGLIAIQIGLTLAIAIASFLLLERRILAGWPRLRGTGVGGTAALAVTAVVAALVLVVPRTAAPFAAAERETRSRSATVAGVPAQMASAAAPHRVMVVGDSVAYTLFPGLRAHEAGSDLYFFNGAETGCPLDIEASATQNEGQPAYPQHLDAECDWPRMWPAMVDHTKPEIVVALWGLWDLFDIEVGTEWLRVGTPEWSQYMARTFEHALDILTAYGAHVVVLSTPYVLVASEARVDALNEVFRSIASTRAADVSIIDTEPIVATLAPERWDSVHFSARGASTLGQAIDPLIARFAGDRPIDTHRPLPDRG